MKKYNKQDIIHVLKGSVRNEAADAIGKHGIYS